MNNKGEILATKLKNFKDYYFFLHNTKEFNVVEKIMNEGFVFESQFSHSTDRINPNEPIEVTYFLFHRKDYGLYTIIIAVQKNTYEFYSGVSKKNDVGIEEVITITDSYYGENDELVFTVSPKHILGYFNNITAEFYQNRNWDPFYNNCHFNTPMKKPLKPGLK